MTIGDVVEARKTLADKGRVFEDQTGIIREVVNDKHFRVLFSNQWINAINQVVQNSGFFFLECQDKDIASTGKNCFRDYKESPEVAKAIEKYMRKKELDLESQRQKKAYHKQRLQMSLTL